MHVRWQTILILTVAAAAGMVLAVVGLAPAFGDESDQQHATIPQLARDSGNGVPESPSPSASPSPTATPTGSPTQLPGGYEIRKVSHYTDDDSDAPILHIVGEVANNNAAAAGDVVIEVTFLSATNTVLGTDFTTPAMRVIGAGDDSPFELLSVGFPAFDHFTLAVTEAEVPSADPVVTGLEVQGAATSYDDNGHLHISGMVKNTSNHAYDFVEPIGALYDAGGNVLRVSSTFTEPFSIAAATSEAFEIVFQDPPTYSSYRLWVNAAP